MTTTQKLWLGFGTLTALLGLSVVAILVRVRSIEGALQEQASVARPRSATARELEINVLGYTLALRMFVQTDDPKFRQNAAENVAAVERQLAEYERLAATERQRGLAARFAEQWRAYQELGQASLNSNERPLEQENSERLVELRIGLERFLNDELQREAIETYDASHEVAFQGVRAIVGFTLTLFLVGLFIAAATSAAVGRGIVKAERQVEDSRQFAVSIVETVSEPLIVLDANLRVVRVNRSFYETFRVVPEETENRLLYDLGNGQWDIPKLRTLLEEILPQHTEVHDYEVEHDFPGIGRRIMRLNARRLHRASNDVTLFLLAVHDVTVKEQAERTVRENRELLRVTLASIGDAVIATSTQGQVTYLNAVAESLTGWKTDEATGVPLEQVFRIVNEETRQTVENPATKALRDGVIVGLANHTVLIAKDGSERPIDDSAAPIQDEQGHVSGCVLIFRDITDRKRLENELRQYTADLSDADRRKNEFLAMLAHELRNPLAPIRNALQILHLTRGDGQAVASASEMIDRQIGQMARLVDDLLDVSRISRGKIGIRRERVELASVVNHAVEAARSLVQCMDHDLTITLPPQPIYVYVDPIRLAQVVGNLLNNACKFTDKGGRISLTVERIGEQAVIRVRDNGIGIAADLLPRIFDMFMQADTSLERSVSGLGIGLTLVKTLVEMHDGTMEVQSAGVGQGSEFVVRLPIMAETAKLVPPEPTASEPTITRARRILVVDDNRDSANSLAMLLKLTGHETHTAYDGLEAVEAAATFKPDVVLLDIGLPKLNGYEATRKIREQPWGNGMVLVALTGWGQDEDRQRSKEAGFNAHLVKPVDFAALTKLLAELQPSV